MDYKQLKADVKEIAEIAAVVPEPFRDKCFELLLSSLLQRDDGGEKQENKNAEAGGDGKATEKDRQGKVPVTTQVRVLMRRTGVTEDELNKIILFSKDEVHFIKEPKPKGVTTGQMEWALLLALKNAILKDALTTDPEDLHLVCQEKGYYDNARA